MIDAIPVEIEQTLKSLKVNRFDARYAATSAEALKTILDMIPVNARVGIGDSATLRQMDVPGELAKRENEIINPFTREIASGLVDNPAKHQLFRKSLRMTFGTDVFLASCNAVTQDGKIVSIDCAGNRVAAMIFGAPKVILPVGRNKIVKDVDEAIYRIKNIITPVHAQRKRRKTPCTVTGKCGDCDGADRLCNVTVILEKKPVFTEMSVILVNEDLGLGWDPCWDERRINGIISNYDRQTWFFSAPKS